MVKQDILSLAHAEDAKLQHYHIWTSFLQLSHEITYCTPPLPGLAGLNPEIYIYEPQQWEHTFTQESGQSFIQTSAQIRGQGEVR